ncbi:MAG: hypothetical protein HQM09_19310 [Candidatus Riflebacteria bacterium]|nr:hypothetical protein [Candidatus Riflebacteria bacterium]
MFIKKSRRGQSLTEYSFILGFISFVAIFASYVLSGHIDGVNNNINNTLSQAAGIISPSPTGGTSVTSPGTQTGNGTTGPANDVIDLSLTSGGGF